MSQELTQTAQSGSTMPMPFGQGRTGGLAAGVNGGAVAIEQERAIAEARGQMQLAKMFPRDLNAAFSELMIACKLPALAGVAFYSKPQGGQKVTGPSIRLAEEIARVYGNFEFGHRELSRVEATPTSFGRSEIEVYAWDKEKNNRSIRQITVLHVTDTKEGPRRLRDQSDVDIKIANVASKQARGRILALLPKWLVEAAIDECKKTLAGTNEEPLDARVRKMTQAFAKFGVTNAHLEKYLGHTLASTLIDELIDLLAVYNAIKDGEPASTYFSEQPEEDGAGGEQKQADGLAETAKNSRAARTAAATPKKSGAQAPVAAPAAAEQKQAAQNDDDPADPPAAPPAQTPVAQESKNANANSKTSNGPAQPREAQPPAAAGASASGEQEDVF